MNKYTGMSFAEVLISLFLSSLIVTLLIQFYLGSKRQYTAAEELLKTHFDVHWVGALLSDGIRRAGFTPCLGINQLKLEAEGHMIPSIFWKMNPSPRLQLNRMSERFVEVISVNNTMQMTVPASLFLQEKYPVLIADCDHAEIQHIAHIEKQAHESVVTFVSPLRFTYSKSIYLGEFISEEWFIKNKVLYYKLHHTEEVTALIHSFALKNQVLHGKTFVEMTLELADATQHKLMVSVRGT